MSATVNITQFKQCMEFMLSVSSKGEMRLPVLLHGVHALGKTEIVEQIAKSFDYNYVPLFLSTQDVSDLIGLPYKEHKFMKDGVEIIEKEFLDITRIGDAQSLVNLYKKTSTRFAMPDWLSDALADDRPCIFFLDEMNRGPLYVLQTMLPFVLDGRLHTHRIRPNDIVIGAMNPDTADYNVEAISDKALLSRFAHFYFEPTISEWVSYAMTMGIHPSVIEMVKTSDNIFGKESVPEENRIKVTPDRRNILKIGQFLNNVTEEQMKNNSVANFCTAMVGESVAMNIITSYNTIIKLSPDNIFDGTIFDVGIEYESDLDRIKIINESLIQVFLMGEGKLWESTNKTPSNWDGESTDSYAKFLLNDKELDNLKKWVNVCTKDARLGFIKQLRSELLEKFKTDEEPFKGIFISLALVQHIDETLVDEVFPD